MTNAAEQNRRELTARISAKRAAYQSKAPVLLPSPCKAPDERWTVVHTGERREAMTAGRLRKAGYEVYLPRLIEMRKDYRSHRGKRRVLIPLFEQYLFVKVSIATKCWGEIVRTIGVEGMLLSGEVPARLPDEVIAKLSVRYRENYGEDEKPDGAMRHAKKPKLGARVQVLDGPFKFFDANVDNLDQFDSKNRIGLLLALFGRPVKIELDAGDVEQL